MTATVTLTMAEAASSQSTGLICHLFDILLTTYAISKPSDLWEKYKKAMSEDILM